MTALGSRKLERTTKSRSSALSCSAVPVGSGWKPMMCDRRLSGIRLNRSSLLSSLDQHPCTKMCQLDDSYLCLLEQLLHSSIPGRLHASSRNLAHPMSVHETWNMRHHH